MPETQRRTQGERRALARAKITSAGLEALAANGYDGMTFSDVARRAGLSTGALAHYFPRKQELCLAILEDAIAGGVRRFRRRVEKAALLPDRDERILDDIFIVFYGPFYQAFLAVQVVARADAELRLALDRISEDGVRAISRIAAAGWEVDVAPADSAWHTFVWLIVDTARGVAVSDASDSIGVSSEVWALARRLLLRQLGEMRGSR